MAKRSRYAARPAAKPGIKRPGTAATPAGGLRAEARSGGLTEAELSRAAMLEAELLERERIAIADNARRRARTRGVDVEIAGDPGAPLSVRAAHEYAYVARDIRRIGLTAGLMFAMLAGIWAVVNAGGAGLP
ncbi:MAG: hypothetical protein HW391_1420 [Chloroflexi bacterium]|nr:hypothetical protein [Chloroflexota bacterium]